jgi:hypothetical protein
MRGIWKRDMNKEKNATKKGARKTDKDFENSMEET